MTKQIALELKEDNGETYLYSGYYYLKTLVGFGITVKDPDSRLFLLVHGLEKASSWLLPDTTRKLKWLFLSLELYASPSLFISQELTNFYIPITLKFLSEKLDLQNPYLRDLLRISNDLGVTLGMQKIPIPLLWQEKKPSSPPSPSTSPNFTK